MRILRTPAVLSAATVAALLLAGCGGSDDDAGTAAAASSSAEQDSPLSKYLTAVWGGDLSPEEQERKVTEEMARQEELVAQCMKEEGFEYAPNTAGMSFSSTSDVEWEPDDREWVAQYGYGAVKSPFTEQPEPTEEMTDPNGDYVAALSESEQTAFYEALYGPQPTAEEMEEMEAAAEDGSVGMEYDWQASGCQGRAQHEVSGEDLYQSEEFRPLFDAINDLYTDAATTPEIVALDGEWVACMDAAGQPGFSTQMDAQQSIYDAQNAFYEQSATATSGSVGDEMEFVEPDQAELDALGEKEVALALVDLDCREQTDYTDRRAEVQRQVEEAFIADHQAELDALVAASEQD